MQLSKVAIIGKPNVGKSTLFNRLIHKKKSIIFDTPGVTRDRIYGTVNWLNKEFTLIDTGGLTNKNLPFQKSIQSQAEYAISEADIILFIVSNKEMLDNDDYLIAKLLKKSNKKKIFLVLNKIDINSINTNNDIFYSLGFGKPLSISAEHSIGIGDLLDKIIENLAVSKASNVDSSTRFCVIGRVNVGKSTFVNSILNSDRVLSSPIPNTTRDSVDCQFKYNGKQYVIIDTAGVRKKSTLDNLDKFILLRTQDAILQSQLIVLMLDGSEEITNQDEIIGGMAFKANIPTIIAVNKWDLVKKNEKTMNEFIKKIKFKFHYIPWAPIIFISAKKKSRINKIFEKIDLINEQLKIKVNNSLLNEIILKSVAHNPPPLFKGHRLNISYATQIKAQIPSFVIFTNNPKYLHFSYARFIENIIRKSFGLDAVPITVYYKDKNSRIRGIKQEDK